MNPKRILVVGAGHVGLYAALRLSKKLSSREAEVIVVDPQPHMTYQPFLPEAAAGNISPAALRGAAAAGAAQVQRRRRRGDPDRARPQDARPCSRSSGPTREIAYDHVIVAPGSVSRTLPIPGLHEHGIGFKTIGEAIYLRNHVLDRLDVAAATPDPDARRSALTFVFVGGGYAGIEALAEMEDMARDALRYYPELEPDDMRWVLVEATQRVLPEVDRDMGAYTVAAAAQAEHGHPAGHPAGVLRRRCGEALRRRQLPRRHDRLDGRRQAVADAGPDRPAPRRPAAGSPACRPCRSSTATGWSTGRGAPVTAPPCRT